MKRPRRSTQHPGTERLHSLAEDLDRASSLEIVQRLHEEDLSAVQAVREVLVPLSRAAELAAGALRQGGRLFYVGAGTSGRLGLLDAAECPPTFGTDPRSVQAILAGGPKAFTRSVEGAEDDTAAAKKEIARRRVGPRDCVIGISASSTTPFVRAALLESRRRKASTVLVCCNEVESSSVADVVVSPLTGAEVVAGSTRLKAGTATKLVLNAISTAVMIRLGKVYRGRMIDVRPTNAKLRRRATAMVSELGGVPLNVARRLLQESKDSPRVALIRAWTGASAAQAKRLAATTPLRELKPG